VFFKKQYSATWYVHNFVGILLI